MVNIEKLDNFIIESKQHVDWLEFIRGEALGCNDCMELLKEMTWTDLTMALKKNKEWLEFRHQKHEKSESEQK